MRCGLCRASLKNVCLRSFAAEGLQRCGTEVRVLGQPSTTMLFFFSALAESQRVEYQGQMQTGVEKLPFFAITESQRVIWVRCGLEMSS
jgi:hypothetical protein